MRSTDPSPEIDRILEAIRAEARARGSRSSVGAYSTAVPAPGAPVHVAVATHGLGLHEPTHVADFLVMPLDVFLGEAYRRVLAREPDAGGLAHYQRALLRGRLTRAEVLGRLAFSPEGRRRGAPIAGLAPAFALSMAYRVPFVGPVLAVAARLLALPAHWQDRSGLERAVAATGAWMKR